MTPALHPLAGLPEPHEVFRGFSNRPGSFLLESASPTGGCGRYSFLGADPFLRLVAHKDRLCWRDLSGRSWEEPGDVRDAVRGVLAQHRCVPHPELPFCGGAVGYWSYELGARWEEVPRRFADRSGAAEVELGFHDGTLAYDHLHKRWYAAAVPLPGRSVGETLERLRGLAEAWRNVPEQAGGSPPCGQPVAQMSQAAYSEAVHRIRAYIASGDVYQVNLAHRFEMPVSADSYELYCRLRRISPAPFAGFLQTEFGQVVSCSPESFLRVRGRTVETRPIKGTRRRGTDRTEDERLSRELRENAKERAELLMIVDLERNDLGRVCVPGSIHVPALYVVEEHPTVFHLVATVTGELRSGCDALDLLHAAFPGGSITGAPKIRAMQVIDELETAPRGIYTGAIGYLGFDGDCDLNIAIRTIVCAGGKATYHVGAGIVWDSDPISEYEETLAKGRALREALIGSTT